MLRLKVFILLFSAVVILAFANYFINPNRPPLSQNDLKTDEILLSGALAMGDRVLWLDARSKDEFESAHIVSALNLNEDQWEDLLPEVLNFWRPGQSIVVYCGGGQCQASRAVADRLRSEAGFSDVYVLKGGWQSWLARSK